MQGATTKQAPSRATKQGPSRATKQGPMGRVTTSAKPCTALTPSSFSLAWLMSTAAHAGKVIFNNNPFGISHNVTHIHTVQRAAPLPCVVSHCPFQCVPVVREKFTTCSVFWVTGLLRESQTDTLWSCPMVGICSTSLSTNITSPADSSSLLPPGPWSPSSLNL